MWRWLVVAILVGAAGCTGSPGASSDGSSGDAGSSGDVTTPSPAAPCHNESKTYWWFYDDATTRPVGAYRKLGDDYVADEFGYTDGRLTSFDTYTCQTVPASDQSGARDLWASCLDGETSIARPYTYHPDGRLASGTVTIQGQSGDLVYEYESGTLASQSLAGSRITYEAETGESVTMLTADSTMEDRHFALRFSAPTPTIATCVLATEVNTRAVGHCQKIRRAEWGGIIFTDPGGHEYRYDGPRLVQSGDHVWKYGCHD